MHEFLQRRYYDLLAEMEDENFDDIAVQRTWSAKLLTVSGDEPMPMRALDAIAYNKALSAIYSDESTLRENRQRVTWLQRRLRHVFAFHAAEFPTEASLAGNEKHSWWSRLS